MLHATWVLAAREIKTSGERVEQTKNGLISPKNRLKQAKTGEQRAYFNKKWVEKRHNYHFWSDKQAFYLFAVRFKGSMFLCFLFFFYVCLIHLS